MMITQAMLHDFTISKINNKVSPSQECGASIDCGLRLLKAGIVIETVQITERNKAELWTSTSKCTIKLLHFALWQAGFFSIQYFTK